MYLSNSKPGAWSRGDKLAALGIAVALIVAVATITRDTLNITFPFNPEPTSTVSSPTPGATSAQPGPTQTTPPPVPSPGPATSPPRAGVFNEFDLEVADGFGYDLDIAPGQDPATHSGWSAEDKTAEFRDLYRTSEKAPPEQNQLQGWERKGKHNRVVTASRTATAAECLKLDQDGGGTSSLEGASAGSKLCVNTYEGRWALVEITRINASRDPAKIAAQRRSTIRVHVTVLAP